MISMRMIRINMKNVAPFSVIYNSSGRGNIQGIWMNYREPECHELSDTVQQSESNLFPFSDKFFKDSCCELRHDFAKK